MQHPALADGNRNDQGSPFLAGLDPALHWFDDARREARTARFRYVDVAHPQLAGLLEGEAAAVGAVGRLLVEQALAAEEPVHGGRGERMIHTVLAGLLDDPAHRPCRIVGLQLDEVRGDLGRKPPGLPPVGSRLGVERIEPAVAVHPRIVLAATWVRSLPGMV